MLYSFELQGEDHTHFVYDVEALSKDDAFNTCELMYPEARIISCHSKDELIELEAARYEHISRMYEEGWDYE